MTPVAATVMVLGAFALLSVPNLSSAREVQVSDTGTPQTVAAGESNVVKDEKSGVRIAVPEVGGTLSGSFDSPEPGQSVEMTVTRTSQAESSVTFGGSERHGSKSRRKAREGAAGSAE